MRNMHTLLIITLSTLTLLAASMPATAAIKCWTNKEGVHECGGKVPPEYAQQGHQELTEQGFVKSEQERAKTDEELREEARLAAIEAEKKRQEEEQARRDKILLDTFSSVEDIEHARDEKIAALQATINLTRKLSEAKQDDLDKRIKAAAAEERSGKNPNEALQKDIESLRRQIKNNEDFIEGKRKEQEEVKTAYDKDIERFLTLRGGNR